MVNHTPPKPYRLTRDQLSIGYLVTLLEQAVVEVREREPGQQAHAWRARVGTLLPAMHRSLGESWVPGASADLDDWARLGAYHGALDGWARGSRHTPTSGSTSFDRAYATAYSAAFSLSVLLGSGAQVQVSQDWQVSRG